MDSVGPKTPKITENFLIRTISGDDVIATDKTSKTCPAITWLYIEKREYNFLNSFLQAFQKYIFWLPVSKFFHFRSDQTPVTFGNGKICLPFFQSTLGIVRSSISQNISFFHPRRKKLDRIVNFCTRIWWWLMVTSSFLKK